MVAFGHEKKEHNIILITADMHFFVRCKHHCSFFIVSVQKTRTGEENFKFTMNAIVIGTLQKTRIPSFFKDF